MCPNPIARADATKLDAADPPAIAETVFVLSQTVAYLDCNSLGVMRKTGAASHGVRNLTGVEGRVSYGQIETAA